MSDTGSWSGRFNLSALAMTHRAVTLFAMLAIAVAGAWAYANLGRAEDPPFTVKQMLVFLSWPGASAEDMTRTVTDRVERKLQEVSYLDYTSSYTKPGEATILVVLKDSTPAGKVPDIWYQVRKKINDMRAALPDGVAPPAFNDEFGDVFGIVYAFTGDGFSLPQLRHVVEDVRQELLSVPGVGKIDLLGEQEERLYVDFSYSKLARMGLSVQDLFSAIRRENSVIGGGVVDTTRNRVFVRTGGGIDGAAALGALPVQAQGHLIPLEDVASISRATADPPEATVQVNGKPALALAISMAEGDNILRLGQLIAKRMKEIAPRLPLGVSFQAVHDQSAVVKGSVSEFQESFLEALAIVLLVSFVSLGWRTGLVVAISVPLVLAGVLVGMKLAGIDLQRISLGAMIIALGLLVDDAIIAGESMLVKLDEGWSKLRAGSFAYTSTAFPMLTGTLVTAAGFLPVGLAQSGTGEYTVSIFWVVGLSLILSWFVAVLFVPYLGSLLMQRSTERPRDGEVAQTRIHRVFRRVVTWCVRRRWLVIGFTVVLFAAAAVGFTRVPQQFFPSSARLEVVVDLRLPDGSSFAATTEAVSRLRAVLDKQPGIRNYVEYVGRGSPRFFLASLLELTNANFAQVIINTTSVNAREALMERLGALANGAPEDGFDDVRMRVSRLELGPPVGYPVQFRIIGHDGQVLRQIGDEVRQAVRANPHVGRVTGDWGAQSLRVSVAVDQGKARLLGLTSEDVAQTLQTLLAGATVTHHREGTDLIPIVVRANADERSDLAAIRDIDIPTPRGGTVPLGQIATVSYGMEEPIFWRRNRTPEMTIQADIIDGTQAPVVTAEIQPEIDRIAARLPSGYRIETAGAVAESIKGQDSVIAVLPLMVLATLAFLFLQLRSFPRVAMVVLTAPLGLIGVSGALLVSGAPFGFVAMLGFIALAGIIMRNSVILLDQIERDLAAGATVHEAIIGATVRRSRPIVLTAAATVLALLPLTQSAFWGPMAIAIMGGLVCATALTLAFVPAMYAAWSNYQVQADNAPQAAPANLPSLRPR